MQIRNVLLVAGAASFSTRDVWDGYHHGLRQAGVNVVPYPTFSMLRMLSPEMIGNDIIGKAVDHRNAIDAVIFVDGLYFRERREWVPRSLKELGIPTILIATDDPYEEIERASANYTHRFTNEICSASATVTYLPTAACEPLEGSPGRKHDVVFIGTVFEERWPYLKRLAHHCHENRIRCLIAGNVSTDISELSQLDCVTVQTNVVGAEQKWKLYRGAKVVLNLFRNSDRAAESPNPRVFDVTAVGQPALLTGPNRHEVRAIFGDSVYHFDDQDSMLAQLNVALQDESDRQDRVARAKVITRTDHMYANRAETLVSVCRNSESPSPEAFPRPEKIAWVFGCGRSGSTWLNEMLGDVQGIFSWHEPMFGKLFQFPQNKPTEHDRPESFYFSQNWTTFVEVMRESFSRMAMSRFARAPSNSALVLKDVNACEICPYFREVFPQSNYILLVRDPFDVLDSFLDMQRPGGWNEDYSGTTNLDDQATVSSKNILRSLKLSLRGYDAVSSSRRIMIRYEELLKQPAAILIRCAALLGVNLSEDQAETIARNHDFSNHSDTGRLNHRRFGRAGVWKTSANFTPEVRAIADEVLGGIRAHLEYCDP